MSALIIKDLPLSEELDRKAMAGVRGGYKGFAPYLLGPLYSKFESNLSFDAAQLINQSQDTSVINGVNTAFAEDIKARVNPTQSANNNINFG